MGGLGGNQEASSSSWATLQRLLEAAARERNETARRRSAPADPAAYEEVFQRMTAGVGATQKRLAEEQKLARAQWEALEKHPQARRLVRIRNDHRFQTWGFYQLLLRRSRNLAGSDPRMAADFAEMALAVARCLKPEEHGEERIADFRAGALAALAEAKRQRGDLAGAWDAYEAARDCLEDGTGDPLDKAEMELLRERLLRDFGREEEADRAL
ncbi:MAG TPA: hypothetical protein VGG03_04490, partial [Thermoanaerobaculia bacterium]